MNKINKSTSSGSTAQEEVAYKSDITALTAQIEDLKRQIEALQL